MPIPTDGSAPPHPRSPQAAEARRASRAGPRLRPERGDRPLAGERAHARAASCGANRRAQVHGRARPPRAGFRLTEQAQSLFPSREAEVLGGLAAFLGEEGHHDVLVRYLDRPRSSAARRAMGRLDGMEGTERLEAAARILTEEGYMAEVVDGSSDEAPRIRLCHCPLRELVAVTSAPCRAEIGFVRALVGRQARARRIPPRRRRGVHLRDRARTPGRRRVTPTPAAGAGRRARRRRATALLPARRALRGRHGLLRARSGGSGRLVSPELSLGAYLLPARHGGDPSLHAGVDHHLDHGRALPVPAGGAGRVDPLGGRRPARRCGSTRRGSPCSWPGSPTTRRRRSWPARRCSDSRCCSSRPTWPRRSAAPAPGT